MVDAASLEGTPWVLSAGISVEGWEQAAPTATFEGSAVSGSTGCNRFSGRYALDGDALALSALATTLLACAPPLDAVERAFVAALERVAGWRVAGGELALLDATGEELLRFAPASLAGKWVVTAFRRDGEVTSVLADTEITLALADDGTLVGSGGCNVYRATYAVAGGSIELSAPFSTRKACLQPEGVMEQEAAYLQALPTVARYRLDGRVLHLLTARDTLVATLTRAGG